MRDVAVIGIGQTPIGELWNLSLRELGANALRQAAEDARWHNRVKNYWLPALTLVTGGSVAAVTTWKVLEWFIRSMQIQ